MSESTQHAIVHRTVELRQATWRNVRCARCDIGIEPSQVTQTTEDGAWLQLQGRDALTLAVRPGYGGYIDTLHELEQYGEDEFIVCSQCVDHLRREMPGLHRLLGAISRS